MEGIFALLVKPAKWFPFAAQRIVMASARQAKERAVRPQVALWVNWTNINESPSLRAVFV